jgi:xanthine dehydrogenase accessory factor
MPLSILVRGSNDVGSAVALFLFRAGFAVAIHDVPRPTVTRRKMAFADAIFYGAAILVDVRAELVTDAEVLTEKIAKQQSIPISVDSFESFNAVLRPDVLVDARMRKHTQPGIQIGMAPLTIGLGPNFEVGVTTDLVVETAWENAGRVIRHGSALPLKGEPKPIAGHGRDRYLYAPSSGIFFTTYHPGDYVKEGQEIARINDTALHAPLTGILRGITHDGVPVSARTKVIEVDPRSQGADIAGISTRPAMIAQGVLEAVKRWELNYAN